MQKQIDGNRCQDRRHLWGGGKGMLEKGETVNRAPATCQLNNKDKWKWMGILDPSGDLYLR